MTPTPRAAALVAAVALSALLVPLELAVLALLALAAATVVDALLARRVPGLVRSAPEILYRGVTAPYRLEPLDEPPGPLRLRQPAVPDIRVEPAEADSRLRATLRPLRRGIHTLPRPAYRVRGPLGLGAAYGRALDDLEVRVYPDLPAAWRLALALRRSRFGETGRLTRGPLGLGTDFEAIRDYLPDDDIRQVNWAATQRVGRPMSNQYRVEHDRDVVCLVDTGRLMAAPLGDRTRLDAALDAVAAVAAVADEAGDRSGVIAFAGDVLRQVPPRRRGARAVVRAVFDLEPLPVDSDYELAFRTIADTKRAFVLVLTDLLEETAARPLLDAMPSLRRHSVAVGSAADLDLDRLIAREPEHPRDVYAAAVALEVLAARRRVAAQLRRAGADVIEAPPADLGAACVRAYLRAKARARL